MPLVDSARSTLDGHVELRQTGKNLPTLGHVRSGEQRHPIIPAWTSMWQNVKYVRLSSLARTCFVEATSYPFANTCHAARDQYEVSNRRQKSTKGGAGEGCLCANTMYSR